MSDVEKLKALLVENDEEDALIFQRHVRQAKGYDVGLQWVSNITEAESALGVEAFDMVFLDLNVGAKLLGMELLKRATGRGETTPFVIVTGSGDEKKAVDAMKNGAYDYIVKDSLSPELIEKTIKAVREQYVARREREELIAKLAEISVTDALTGLANRRRLTGKLAEEIARSTRTGRPFAVAMLDLDHFKQVNDEHGHQTGDRVLRKVAETLTANSRAIDLVTRYGGEEFCIIMAETESEGARNLAERLRRTIRNSPEILTTISIGVATWQPGKGAEEMISRADEALYEAKRSGRDRVVIHAQCNPPLTGVQKSAAPEHVV